MKDSSAQSLKVNKGIMRSLCSHRAVFVRRNTCSHFRTLLNGGGNRRKLLAVPVLPLLIVKRPRSTSYDVDGSVVASESSNERTASLNKYVR